MWWRNRNVAEIHEERDALVDEAQAIYDRAHKKAKRNLTDLERAEFNGLLDRADVLWEEIEAHEERKKADRAEVNRGIGRSTALHEAGHAVVAILERTPFTSVRIHRDAAGFTGTGGVYTGGGDLSPVAGLAGRAAARSDEGAGRDLAQAREWCRANRRYLPLASHPQPIEAQLEEIDRRARAIVERERRAIEQLATSLQLRGRMTYSEVREVVLRFLTPEGKRQALGLRCAVA
jgi:hypothetical protein